MMKSRATHQNKRVSNTRQRKQQHLLEVTIRRDIARKQQVRRVIRTVFKLILLVGLIVGVFVGGKETLRRFLWENPDYYLAEVRFVPDGALTREQVLAAAGIVMGRNIFSIDLAKAREGIEKLPQVEVAEIQRILPNRLDISVTERKPIAWATAKSGEDPSVSEKSFLIDGRGVVMRSKKMLHVEGCFQCAITESVLAYAGDAGPMVHCNLGNLVSHAAIAECRETYGDALRCKVTIPHPWRVAVRLITRRGAATGCARDPAYCAARSIGAAPRASRAIAHRRESVPLSTGN